MKEKFQKGRIMVKFDFYAIYVETSERSGEVVDVFSSFEECIEHRMEHANWFCPKATAICSVKDANELGKLLMQVK